MKFVHLALGALCSASLISCGTLGGLMNSYPVKLLDQLGTSAVGLISESRPSDVNGAKVLKDRAQQVEARGVHLGHGAVAPIARQSMAAR